MPKSSIPNRIKDALKKAQVNTENPDIKKALEELDISLSTFSKRLLNKLGHQGWLIGYNYGDEKMYKFLSDYIEKKTTEKIYLWAHNYHIAKGNPAEWIPPNNSQINEGTQLKPLGQCIHEDINLSAQYKNIGFCHNFTYIDSDNQSQNVPSDSFEGRVLEYDKATDKEESRIINLRNDVPIPENSEDRSNKTKEPVMIALCLDYNVPNKVIRKSHAPAQLRKCLDGIIFLKNANTNNWLA